MSIDAPVKKRSVFIYLPSLAGGGVERLSLHLAPVFMAAGYDVTFVLHRAVGELISAVPDGVRVVSLNCRRTIGALFPLIKLLRAEKPDVLLSSLGHNNIIAIWSAAIAHVKTRVIVCQHNALSSEKVRDNDFQFWILPYLYKIFLRFADDIVCVSKGVADDLARCTGLARERIKVIYNPVVFRDFDARMNETIEHPWLSHKDIPVILGVGRFVEQKDFALLLSAFAKVAVKRPLRLMLLGDGPLRSDLETQAQKLGITDRIAFLGYHKNPLPFIRHASVLVMSSLYEGFGNVLVEGLACGTQTVSTDCTYGPSEILDHGTYGPLTPVGDIDAMASAIEHALDHPLPTEMLRKRGQSFTVEKAAEQYLAAFVGKL